MQMTPTMRPLAGCPNLTNKCSQFNFKNKYIKHDMTSLQFFSRDLLIMFSLKHCHQKQMNKYIQDLFDELMIQECKIIGC